MWTNYALSFWRSLARRPLYGALNVLGLAVGIATFLVLFLVVRFETTYDRWIPDAQNIYRLDELMTLPGRPVMHSAASGAIMLPALQADYPQIAAGVRMVPRTLPVKGAARLASQSLYYVDPSFFDVFHLPLVAGSASNALQPYDVVLSESAARKYFGETAPIGRTLTVDASGWQVPYRVTAVFKDLPANSSLEAEVLLANTANDERWMADFNQWGPAGTYVYVRFRSPAGAVAVARDLAAFIHRRAPTTAFGGDPAKVLKLQLTPLLGMHFGDGETQYPMKPGADWRVVASLGVVGALALLIAMLNYVNLASAQAVLRAREVAMRKVLGATRRALLVQFLGESLALALLAALIGLALTELALPTVNALDGTALKLDYLSDGVLPVLAAIVLLVELCAGAYPAAIISGFAPAPVLASAKAPGGGRAGSRVRMTLVLLQFSAAIGFAICTLVVGAQTHYLRNADRGFRREGLILVDSTSDYQFWKRQRAILAAFARTPGVTSVTISNREPATNTVSFGQVSRPGLVGPPPSLTSELVGDRYFETYGISTVAGRTFDPARREDDLAGARKMAPQQTGKIMLNLAGVRALGFRSPQAAVGQAVNTDFGPATVIGVVQDARFMSPREPVAPLFYAHDTTQVEGGVVAVRYAGVDEAEIMNRLGAAWRRIAPEVPFDAKTTDGKLSDYFVQDERRARLFGLGAFVAVALGCVGLFGLAAFTTTRRTKEIGVRKALGASTADVLRLLVGQFLRPVLLANLIAWPLAWLVLRAWLAGFDQRIALGPGYFLLVGAGALALAVGTVADQAFRVARTQPARALRYE